MITATAAGETSGLESADVAECQADVWIVNTRCLGCGCCCATSQPDLEILHWDSAGNWQAATVEDLISGQALSVTTIYVHGNRIEADEVEQRLWQAYEGIHCGLPLPMRMVFWSWPSDRIAGQLRDVRYKLCRADCEAYYLAHFLRQQPNSNGSVALVGYSLGARVVAGALHLLAGGDFGCHRLAPPSTDVAAIRPRVVLMAPAIECGSLSPCGEMSLAYSQSANVSILFNSLDPVLKRYWLLDVRNRPQAIGYRGQAAWQDGPTIEQVDVRAHIGRSHSESRYFNSCFVTEFLREEIVAADRPL